MSARRSSAAGRAVLHLARPTTAPTGDRRGRPGAGRHRTGAQRRPARGRGHRCHHASATRVVVDAQQAPSYRASGRSETSAARTSSSTWPTTRPASSSTTCCSRAPCRVRPPLRAACDLHSPQIASVGKTENELIAAGTPYISARGVRRHRLRLGDGGHHRLREGARRPGLRPAARRPHHRAAGTAA